MIIECEQLEGRPHIHEFPDDWIFGGADGLHPGADTRYQPTTYIYYNEDLTEASTVSHLLCDDEALDYFSTVAKIVGNRPKWVSVKRPGEKLVMLAWTYNTDTDELMEKK